MICTACKAELADNARSCPKCGAKSAPNAAATLQTALGLPSESANDVETELWAGGFSGKAMVGHWLLATSATIGLVVAGVAFPPGWIAIAGMIGVLWVGLLVYLLYRKIAVRYKLTTQRLQHERGILVRRTDRIETIDIDDVTFTQGIIERLFGVGSIKLTSSDRTDPELILDGIDHVQAIANLIDETRRRERRRRGVHIEQI